MLNSFPVHPVHLKAGLMRQITGLHYGSRPVDMGKPQNMTDLMNPYLKKQHMNGKSTSHKEFPVIYYMEHSCLL